MPLTSRWNYNVGLTPTRLCLLLLLLCLPAAADTTLWVAPNGNDASGDGSQNKPLATITRAVQIAPVEGASVVVRDGFYPEAVLVRRQFDGWLLVRAENPYKAILGKKGAAPLVILDSSNVMISGFDIHQGEPGKGALLVHIARSRSIILTNNLMHDVESNDLLKINEGSQFVLIHGNLFWNARDNANGSSNGQDIDINGCLDVHVSENIFFESSNADEDTRGGIVVKNSGDLLESQRTVIERNVFLHYQGGAGSNWITLGEDAKPFYETHRVLIQNNLFIGDSDVPMRAPLGIKGARDVTYRNNTITGDQPARHYAARINVESPATPLNRSIRFFNNIWSDPAGTMSGGLFARADDFAQAQAGTDVVDLITSHNLYWNGGQAIPGGQALSREADDSPVVANPGLVNPVSVLLPVWSGVGFHSGSTSIAGEFRRLVDAYGTIPSNSAAVGKGRSNQMPALDIRGTSRVGTDIGAAEAGGNWPEGVRMILPSDPLVAGSEFPIGLLILPEPAGAGGQDVQVASSNPGSGRLARRIDVPAGFDRVPMALIGDEIGETEITILEETGSATRRARPTSRTTASADRTATGLRLTTAASAPVYVNLSTRKPAAQAVQFAGRSTHQILLQGLPSAVQEVFLSSDASDIISFPVNPVLVQPGTSAVDFSISARPVTKETVVRITALDANGAGVASEPLTIVPGQALTAFETPTHIFNAAQTFAVIELAEPAGPGGVRVQLNSGDPARLSLPSTFTVPAGSSRAEVPIPTSPEDNKTVVPISAALEGDSFTRYIVLAKTQLTGCRYDSNLRKIVVLLNGIAVGGQLFPHGLSCSLNELSDPGNLVTGLPASILIPAGFDRAQYYVEPKLSVAAGAAASVQCTCNDGEIKQFTMPISGAQ